MCTTRSFSTNEKRPSLVVSNGFEKFTYDRHSAAVHFRAFFMTPPLSCSAQNIAKRKAFPTSDVECRQSSARSLRGIATKSRGRSTLLMTPSFPLERVPQPSTPGSRSSSRPSPVRSSTPQLPTSRSSSPPARLYPRARPVRHNGTRG